MPNKNNRKKIPDSTPTPIGVTVGQVRDAYKQLRNYMGEEPKDAPMPAKEHKQKAEKLGTKTEKARQKVTGNGGNY